MIKKIFLSLFIFCSAVAMCAEQPAKSEGNRFLFVVETSSAMNRSAKAAREAVRELIESGVQGQMRPGDSFSLWTFNEKLNAEYPLQRWMPEENKKLAAMAADFLKQRHFEKKAQLQTMLPPLYSVLKSSKAITVILISTGTEMIQGTPFDKEINGVYPVYVRALRDAKIPFVTILVGRYGKPAAYSVNSSLSIQIPNPPLHSEIEASQAKTNSPVGTNKLSTVKTNQGVPGKRLAKENIIISKPVATNQPPVIDAAAVTNQEVKVAVENKNPVVVTISSNVTPAKLPASVLIAEANSKTVPVVATAITQVEAAPSLIPTQVTAAPVIQSPKDERVVVVGTQKTSAAVLIQPSFIGSDDPKAFKSETPDVASVTKNMPRPRFGIRPNSSKNTAPLEPTSGEIREISAPSISPVPMAVAQPNSAPKKFLLPAAGLILFTGFLVFFIARRARSKSHPSLISRSMDQRPK